MTEPSASMSDLQALTACLTAEGFLLATISLLVSLSAPGRLRQSALPVKPVLLAICIASLSSLLGVAATLAWFGMYGSGSVLPLRQATVAIVILLAVLAQPVISFLLALGLRNAE